MESQPQNPEFRINPENLVSNSLDPEQTRHSVWVKSAGKIFSRLRKLDIIWQSNVYAHLHCIYSDPIYCTGEQTCNQRSSTLTEFFEREREREREIFNFDILCLQAVKVLKRQRCPKRRLVGALAAFADVIKYKLS